LIEGIRSGNADSNQDGLISMEELCDYVFEKVQDECHQKPKKWALDVYGELFIAFSGKNRQKERNANLRKI
jgi:hypothetical protein